MSRMGLQEMGLWIKGMLEVQTTLVLYLAERGAADREDLIQLFQEHVNRADSPYEKNAPQIMVDVLTEEDSGPKGFQFELIEGGKDDDSDD